MAPKFSVVIPTVQKDLDVLNMLIEELSVDNSVGEIIIIDNSGKGYKSDFQKVKVRTSKKNLYVNSSWNLGVKLAKNNYVAILNDDIIIPKSLCTSVLNFLMNNNDCGLIGLDSDCIKRTPKEEFNSYPDDTECSFKKIDYELYHGYWGSAIFGRKKNFYKIPQNLKIWCGDDYYIKKNIDNGFSCYAVTCSLVKHLGSVSSSNSNFEKIKYFDMYNYAKIDPRMKENRWFIERKNKYSMENMKELDYEQYDNSLFQNIFSCKNVGIHKVICIFGIKIKLKSKKLIRRQQGVPDMEYSFAERIFSVKNSDVRKIITILGMKYKFKSRKLVYNKKLEDLNWKLTNLNDKLQTKEKEIKDCINIINEQKREYEHNLCKYMAPEKYPDYLKDWYKRVTGETLNLDNPQTFNEKIQWLKLYDSTPIKTRLADKYLVREWVKEKIGEEYLIPLLGVWDNFDDIDFDELPDKFVLKCNHGSGYNIIVTDKSQLNIEETKRKINYWMDEDFAYTFGLELQYHDIEHKIIAEQYIETENNDLQDYKFLCFNGKVEYIWVDKDRYTSHKRNIYDLDWNLLDKKINTNYENFPSCPPPHNFEKMKHFAETLSQGFSFVRVDFYEHDNKLYFGEMTFTSESGTGKVSPESFAYELGEKIKLPMEERNLVNV